MSYTARYDKGDWKGICDVCGRAVKAHELRQRWDGFMVDDRCWETRHPQDFVRGIPDYQAPPFTKPETQNTFIPIVIVYTPDGTTPINTITSKITLNLKTQIIPNPIKTQRTVNGSLYLLNNITLG
jgi:hypothetical protein